MKLRKNFLLIVLSAIMVCAMALAVISGAAISTKADVVSPSAYNGNSKSFAGNVAATPKGYQLDTKISGTPKTFEAFIKVPTTANEGSRYGVIIGNFRSGDSANNDCFDLEIHGGGNPRLYWYNGKYGGNGTDGTANGVDWRLTDVNVATNTWTHLAFVRDTVNDKVYCYVNGELVGTHNDAGADMIPGSWVDSLAGNLSVGKDNRTSTDLKSTYFQGNIAYVSLSSSIKTQAQVKESMSKMASSTATSGQGNLLFLNFSSFYTTSTALNYKGEGLDYSNANGNSIMETLTAAPKTVEAFVRVNPTTKLSDGRYGVILGNFYSGDSANSDCFDFEIHANGNPRFFWYNGTYSGKAADGTSNGFDWKVTKVNVNTGNWVHIAFVRDTVNDKTHCYVNGVLVDTLANAGEDMIPGTWSGSKAGGLKVGMDSRSNANTLVSFQGQVGYIAVSSKIKTAAQVYDSMKAMEACAVNKDMTTSYADLLLIDRSRVRSYYTAEKALTATPNTITATFKLPKNYAVGFNGTLFGNVAVYASVHGFNLELNAKGHLCIVWNAHKSPNANPWVEFSQDFRTDKWTNVAVVRDKTANCFHLYVNGVLKESSSTATGVGSDIVGTYAPAIGSNFQTTNNEKLLFRGYVKDVAVFSTALTASEVSAFYNTADKTKVSKNDYSSMMLNWVLAENQQSLYYDENVAEGLIDYSGNGNDAFLCTAQHYYEGTQEDKDWFIAGENEYTLIFMPDTQITVSRDIQFYEHNANVATVADLDMTKTFQWIVDNKEKMNLSFVMHMGDLKHARGVSENWNAQNDWREWQLISGKSTYNSSFTTGTTAVSSFSSSFINGQTFGFELLKQAGIPYTMVLGNHDYNAFQMGEGTGRNADYFNYYFSSASYDEKFAKNVVARYDRNHSTYAKNNNTMMNVIYEMEATPKGSSTPIKYLVVALEYGPTNDMIAWANEIVSQPRFSSHRVIVNTHALMYSDGEFMSDLSSWNPSTYGYSKDPGTLETNNGMEVWNKLISQNDNAFLSSGGHVSQETLMTRTDLGIYNNEVFSMLVDWQDSFQSRGDSLLLVAKVNEKTQKISFRVYNPVSNEFYLIENEQEYDFSNSFTREVKKDSKVNYSKNYAKVGETVVFSVNKTEGYVSTPKVVDALGNSIAVTYTTSGYTFTMPSAKVTISVEQEAISGITLPESLSITKGDSVDLSTYLPSAYNYSISVDGTSVTNSGKTITGASVGASTIIVSIDGYGEVARCVVTVKEQQQTASSTPVVQTSSSVSSVQTSSEPTSQGGVTQSSEKSSSVVVNSSSSKQPVVSQTTPARGGCGASIGIMEITIIALVCMGVAIVFVRKKNKQ